jgi:hypothetical protein
MLSQQPSGLAWTPKRVRPKVFPQPFIEGQDPTKAEAARAGFTPPGIE